MRTHIYVSICVASPVFIRVYISMYPYRYLHTYASIYTYRVYIHIHTYVSIYTHHTYVCIYTYIYGYIYVSHIFVYIYIYIYICIFIYTYLCTCVCCNSTLPLFFSPRVIQAQIRAGANSISAADINVVYTYIQIYMHLGDMTH